MCAAILLWGTFAVLPSSAGVLHPNLIQHLDSEQPAENGGLVPVIVFMKDKADLEPVRGSARSVCRLLRKTASDSQKGLINFLDSLASNAIADVQSLWAVNAVILKARHDVIEMMAARDDVDLVALDEIIKLPDEPTREAEAPGREEVLWNVAKVRAPLVWDQLGLTGDGVTVGHLDTGIDADHPDVAGKVVAFRDFTKNGVDSAPYDDHSHGTHTAGTICGGNDSGRWIGVAPNARVLVAKVFGGSGSSQSSWLLNAMQWMLDPDDNPDTQDTPRLVSNSWGSNDSTNTTYWDVVEAWVAAEIFPCFSAGNNGSSGTGTIGTPAAFPHSFAVGATDKNNKLAYFSSKGPVSWDGIDYIKPNVSGPGKDVTSSMPGGGYASKSGTSMSCPAVAGVIALLFQADPGLTVSDVTSILEATAVDLGDAGNDNYYGHGLVDALAACEFVTLGGTLKGTVYDHNGQPVSANVIVAEAGRTFTTGDDGAFSFLLKEGTYSLKASKFGCQPYEASVTVTRKQETIHDIHFKEAVKVAIRGRIVDSAGNPLVARVLVEGDGMPETQTDTNGAYTLRLPSGVYSLAASCFGYATVVQEITLVESDIQVDFSLEKLPPILVVDDDKNKNYGDYFKQALNECDYAFSYMDVASGDAPGASILLQYPLVIWFTGDDSSTTLKEADQETVKKYLAGGGCLLITGQDIGYDLRSEGFVTDVLKADYKKDNSGIHSLTGTCVPFDGMSIRIKGGTGASNQKWPDVIEAVNGGTRCFAYKGDGNPGAAVLHTTETSKIIYLGFGFEGISTAADRAAVLSRACGWLMPDAFRTLAQVEAAIKKASDTGLKKTYRDAALERIIAALSRDVSQGETESIRNWARAIRSMSLQKSEQLKGLIRATSEWASIQSRRAEGELQTALKTLQEAAVRGH